MKVPTPSVNRSQSIDCMCHALMGGARLKKKKATSGFKGGLCARGRAVGHFPGVVVGITLSITLASMFGDSCPRTFTVIVSA
jgi:hypothetical protein